MEPHLRKLNRIAILAGLLLCVLAFAAIYSASVSSGVAASLSALFVLLSVLLFIALGVLNKLRQTVRLERQQAEQSRQTLITYVRVLSHEVRNPINAVLSNIGELRTQLSSPKQLRELAQLEQAAQNANDVVENIVTINQPNGLQGAAEHRVTRLADTIETCFRIVRFSNVNGVELDYLIDPDVPEKVVCDALRLSQILLNLLGNAIKFTLQGSVHLHVENEKTAAQDIIKFTVRDEGPGIPAAERDAVFEAYQLGSSTVVDGSKQSGLGLALVKKLVADMGGAIEVESMVGVGSAFIVSLPLPAASEAPVFTRSSVKSAAFENSKPKVLVAEDNEINQMISQRMLEKLGCQVSVASDGVQAVQFAIEGTFDLVLMDLQMPKVNGIEACRQILVNMEHAPHIIAMTANVLDEERRRCVDAGMSDFLAKPVKLESLQTCLRKHGLSV